MVRGVRPSYSTYHVTLDILFEDVQRDVVVLEESVEVCLGIFIFSVVDVESTGAC